MSLRAAQNCRQLLRNASVTSPHTADASTPLKLASNPFNVCSRRTYALKKDPRAVLGLKRDPSWSEVIQARTKLIKELHPDTGKRKGVDAFHEVQEAYETLRSRHLAAEAKKRAQEEQAMNVDVPEAAEAPVSMSGQMGREREAKEEPQEEMKSFVRRDRGAREKPEEETKAERRERLESAARKMRETLREREQKIREKEERLGGREEILKEEEEQLREMETVNTKPNDREQELRNTRRNIQLGREAKRRQKNADGRITITADSDLKAQNIRWERIRLFQRASKILVICLCFLSFALTIGIQAGWIEVEEGKKKEEKTKQDGKDSKKYISEASDD